MDVSVKVQYADGRVFRFRRRVWPFFAAGLVWSVVAGLAGWPWPAGLPVAAALTLVPTAWVSVSLWRELSKALPPAGPGA